MALLLLALLAQPAFERDIRPMLKQYCLGCHSAAQHAGDLNLERVPDPKVWQKMVEQLSLGEMPPKVMPQPSAAERAKLIAFANNALNTAARAHAGDPGPVVLRRLNNAEYTFTIRDLTNVASLDPAKEFPADGAAGEGFMNTGNALAMSPSLVSKYLEAGKGIASHAVLLPNGIRFSPSSTRRDWTNEILAEIRAFYQTFTEAGGAETVTQQGMALDKNRGGTLPLRKYLLASRGEKQPGLSPKYLAGLTALMQGTRPSPILNPLRARWRAGDVDGIVREIGQWQETLWKFSSVGHIGKVDGPKAWMEPVTPIVEQQEFRVKLPAPASGNELVVYLAAHDAGDGSAGDSVVWREPKLVIPGRAPVLLRDLPAFVADLTARRARIFAATAGALQGAPGTDPEARKAWSDYLSGEIKLDLLTKKIEKTATYDFIQGWGTPQTPMVLANSSREHVRVPGNMKPHGVAVHPSTTLHAAVGWRSPVAVTVRVEGTVTRAHVECGNGILWSLELRRGSMRQRLAEGESRGATPVKLGPFERVRVQPGDLISVLIGPREANNSCDLTDVDLKLDSNTQRWSLADDVSGNILAANPHGVWNFYTEPVAGEGSGTVLPSGSLLAKWQAAESASEKQQLAEALQALLTAAAPPATGPDAALSQQLSSLAGPLFAGVTPRASADSPDIRMQAPSLQEVRLPADLVANSQFVTTGELDAEGTVQLEVLTAKPEPRKGLLPAGTTIGDAKGTWSSNNQVVTYAMPVLVKKGSAARKRVEAAFDEFRQMFPASVCYTKIVPVDEVVTLTLFHREDQHLARLILDDKQKARLDRLWDELHYVSRDALTLVDAFEQIWQFATQDADPSKFEPMRQPLTRAPPHSGSVCSTPSRVKSRQSSSSPTAPTGGR
jgi:hypothetical protein